MRRWLGLPVEKDLWKYMKIQIEDDLVDFMQASILPT